MRLDTRMVEQGLVPTRSRARDLILRGFVHVGGAVCVKPSQDVPENVQIAVQQNAPDYVSRGAEKLEAALQKFGFGIAGGTALDLGASTGGFVQVLLQHGARRVYAVDVGTGQLHETLKADGRVVSLEQRDARTLVAADLDAPVDAIVADVSFISVLKVLAPCLSLASPAAWLIALIKPQFEVGPERVGSGGIVRDEAARTAACESVRAWLAEQPGWQVAGLMPSPISGGSGNVEYLIGARRGG